MDLGLYFFGGSKLSRRHVHFYVPTITLLFPLYLDEIRIHEPSILIQYVKPVEQIKHLFTD